MEIERNTQPKEFTIEHKFECLLQSKTLTYGEMLGLMRAMHTHSTNEDFRKLQTRLKNLEL
jgi:hypothetical protein